MSEQDADYNLMIETCRKFIAYGITILPSFSVMKAEFNKLKDSLKSYKDYFKTEKNKDGIKTVNAYSAFFDGISSLEDHESQKAVKMVNKAIKSFPGDFFEIEKYYFHLVAAVIWDKLQNDQKKLKACKDALDHLKQTGDSDTSLTGDAIPDQQKFLDEFMVDLLYPIKENIGKIEKKIILLEKKISLINRETDDEFFTASKELFETRKEYIKHLFNEGNFEKALTLILDNNHSLSSFAVELNDLFHKFDIAPTIELANVLIMLVNFKTQNIQDREMLENAKEQVITSVSDFILKKPVELLKVADIKLVLDFILKGPESLKKFISGMSELTEELVIDPNNKEIISFLLNLNEILGELGHSSEAQVVHKWIQATLQLRKVNTNSSTYGNTLINIFNDTNGIFAPLALIRGYYDNVVGFTGYSKNIKSLNNASDFISKITESTYGMIDSPVKGKIFGLIEEITRLIAGHYNKFILNQMRQQDIKVVTSLGSKFVLANIMKNIAFNNPLPCLLAFNDLIENWRRLPALTKTFYLDPYTRRVMEHPPYRGRYLSTTTSVKPIFWFSIFQEVMMILLTSTQQRLLKSQEMQKDNLNAVVRGQIRLFHYLGRCMRDDPRIPSNAVPREPVIIDMLKKLNDMIKFSDEELRGIVESSPWSRNTDHILSKVIEYKNYCVYCNYNMPRGATVCPNCNREVKEIEEEAPGIDMDAMSSFFTASGSGAASGAPGGVKKCPTCGGLVDADTNRCVNCNRVVS